MAWGMVAAAVISGYMSYRSADEAGNRQTRQRTDFPPHIEGAIMDILNRGSDLADREFQPYEGERIVDLSDEEREAIEMTRDSVGMWRPAFERSADYYEEAGKRFSDADMEAYMSPYIENALDPAARELNEQASRRMNEISGQAAQRGAFGGSRQAILESEAEEKRLQSVSDLYNRGYQSAFDRASTLWGQDQNRMMGLGQAYQSRAQTGSQLQGQDIDRMFRAGGINRMIPQARADFDYQEFMREQNWEPQQFQHYLNAFGSLPYGGTRTTTQTGGGPNPWAQGIGTGISTYGALQMMNNDQPDNQQNNTTNNSPFG